MTQEVIGDWQRTAVVVVQPEEHQTFKFQRSLQEMQLSVRYGFESGPQHKVVEKILAAPSMCNH